MKETHSQAKRPILNSFKGCFTRLPIVVGRLYKVSILASIMMRVCARCLVLFVVCFHPLAGYSDTLDIGTKSEKLLATPLNDYEQIEKLLAEITRLQENNVPTRAYLKAVIYYSKSLLVTGQFLQARDICRKGLGFARAHGFNREEGILYSNLGIACMNLGKADTAIVYFENAGRIFSAISDRRLQASSHQNIGSILLSRKQYDKALPHFQLARKHFMAAGDTVTAAYADINLALIGKKTGAPEKAIATLESCYRIALRKNDPELRFAAASNLSDMYTDRQEFDRGGFYANDMLTTGRSLKSDPKKALAWSALSRIYKHNKETELEKTAIDSVIVLGEKSLEKFRLLEMYRQAALLYEQTGNPDKAVDFYKKYIAVMEETNNMEINRMVMETEGRFENNRKTLELANKEKELATRNGWILLIASLFIILLLLTLILVYRNRKNIELLRKEKELAAVKAMLKGEANERQRTSRELHDGLSALLAAVRLRFVVFGKNEGLQDNAGFNEALEQLTQAASETRRISHNLLPEILLEHGLGHAIENYIKQVSQGLSMQVHYHDFTEGLPDSVDKNTAMHLFRIIQELLNNALKHSHAQNVYIQFNRQPQQLVLTVEDDGRGFDNSGQKGAGFLHLHERIEGMNGRLTIESAIGKGTTILLYIPLA